MFFVSSVNGDLKPLSDLAALRRDSSNIGAVGAVGPIDGKQIGAGSNNLGQSSPNPNAARGHAQYRDADPEPERQPALVAKQIMKGPVVTLAPTEHAQRALQLFKARRFRHIPIVSSVGRLVGILSDRDFIAPLEQVSRAGGQSLSVDDIPISDLMKTNIVTARPETEIRAIAKVMIERRIGSMPIVDESGKLVGMLTRSDILRAVVNRAPLELWT